MLEHLKTLRTSHIVLGIGTGLTVLAMVMTFKAGRSMDIADEWASFYLGCACALISAGVAIGLHIVDKHRAKGDLKKAASYQRLWYAMLVFEICSAALFTVGHRAANVNAAIAQDAKFEAIGTVATDKRKSLDDLKGELEAFQAANPWSLTTEASGLEADKKLLKDKVDLEASRGGCKDKCMALKAQLADVEKRIGALAKRNQLTARMDELKTKVEETTVAAATTNRGSSAVTEASLMFARFGTLSLDPGKDAVGWSTNISGLVMSVIFSIAAAMLMREGLSEYLPHGSYTPDIDHSDTAAKPIPAPVAQPAQVESTTAPTPEATALRRQLDLLLRAVPATMPSLTITSNRSMAA